MTDFRNASPDLNFWGAADLIAEGEYVDGVWEGGGTHTAPAFSDFLLGTLPASTDRSMKFTGTTVLKFKDGKILEEIGLACDSQAPVGTRKYFRHFANCAGCREQEAMKH